MMDHEWVALVPVLLLLTPLVLELLDRIIGHQEPPLRQGRAIQDRGRSR
jgi:hypothetical protein